MAKTASHGLVETLMELGVDTEFGISGNGINGIIESVQTAKTYALSRFVMRRRHLPHAAMRSLLAGSAAVS
jgi:thiamine pyrophosphate-dependent acetolactate synthase large subunit-like protein